ncbi:MAG: ATP-dependent RNA helicase dbp4 [Gomphillus americanus]|uniref:ATP-dependent RNA helicase n=1 Tax=Gomphillus americanus TaxID=1940652 RepID=A0A8H3EBQ7_9LECA|nr:MAG: ATP-dependent RNA helicase dbp4 [Gomphillus americanus]
MASQPVRSSKKGPKPQHQNARSLKRKRQEEDHADLETKVQAIDLAAPITNFVDLPLSKATAAGLADSHFKTLTAIQQKGIPIALKGSDILGAAKTGSGKTLAFLVPVLEKLVLKKWTEFDGLGALIMSPTRELAIQIFEVLRKIGRYHSFSAGLVIGGKSLQEERERLGRMNILVCTPGRMLQHLDQTAAFEVDDLQILVLDEADRILDMGFQSTVDALLDHLPKTRQTLLFSATQTKRVSDLARLNLKDPVYVSVHEDAIMATPDKLKQNFVVTSLPDKLDTLWSFLRANTKSKIIVFLSSGKQVRFVYESFRHLQPGIPLMHLHGRQKQAQRLETMHKFTSSKNACLFSTDVAARGLDFPAVDWVLQLDCPEDAETYIHRVGRTARFEQEGRAVLFLEPNEQDAMLKRLEQKKVPIEEIKVKQNKQQSIKTQLQNMCFKDPELKFLGQRAFIAYVKSIFVQKDKEIFNLQKMPLEEYAASLGLPGAPRIKFMKGDTAKERKNASREQKFLALQDQQTQETNGKAIRTRYDRMFERQNQNVLSSRYTDLVQDGERELQDKEEDDESEEDFMKPKRRLASNSLSPEPLPDNSLPAPPDHRTVKLEGGPTLLIDSKRREKLLKSKKKLAKLMGKGHKLVFDEDGNPQEIYKLENEEDFKKRGSAAQQRQQFVEQEAAKVKTVDVGDKELAKHKKQEQKARRKAKERAAKENQDVGGGAVATLGGDEELIDPFADDYYNANDSDGSEAISSLDRADTTMPKTKRKKADTETDIGSSNRKKNHKTRVSRNSVEPETLEDLEALAASYL